MPALASSKHVVVAPATKALQDQLANKDLPLVASGLGQLGALGGAEGSFELFCRQRLVELERLGEQQRIDAPLGDEAPTEGQPPQPEAPDDKGASRAPPPGAWGEVRRLVEWAASTASGDRAELDFEPSSQAWSSLSVAADEYPGARRCPSGGECFAEAAGRGPLRPTSSLSTSIFSVPTCAPGARCFPSTRPS